MTLYGIQFRPCGQIYSFLSPDLPLGMKDAVIVEADQGINLGWVARITDEDETPAAASLEESATDGGAETTAREPDAEALHDDLTEGGEAGRSLKTVIRKATQEDLARLEENRGLAAQAKQICQEQIRALGLEMKLVDVEVFLDRSKYVFFFTAPNRIDFRELVKELVRRFHTRIELRQIGVRNETQMIGGMGNCGMPCCCRRYIRKFAPVTIKMAKEQNLFLNPAKISGTCGRLLCCLAYEQPNYDEFHGACPRIGKKYATARGPMKILRANFFRDSLTVLNERNEEEEITLEQWNQLKAARPEARAGERPAQEVAEKAASETEAEDAEQGGV